MLIKVAGKDTASVVGALSKHVRTLPQELRRSLTWDRGKEMADRFHLHHRIGFIVRRSREDNGHRIGSRIAVALQRTINVRCEPDTIAHRYHHIF